jgi:hypothetical protein
MAAESRIRQNSLLISLIAGNSDAETGSRWTLTPTFIALADEVIE